MAAGQDRHQRVFDHPVLAEDDGGDCLFRGADLTGDLFGRTDDRVLEFSTLSAPAMSVLPLRSLATPPVASSCHEPHAKLVQRPCIR